MQSSQWRSVVLGMGSCLPDRCVPNLELEQLVDTTDAWIVQRTGIRQRHIAGPGETTTTLGTQAALAALKDAGCGPEDIDLIVCATSTPDYVFPASAVQIQAALGITQGTAFDIQAVCSGFIFGLANVNNFLRSGSHKRALLIGAETFSRLIDWKDRTTCVLFGDGAGAMVLEAQPQESAEKYVAEASLNQERGVLHVKLRSDGRYWRKLYVDGGASTTQTIGHVRMEGREVFRYAVSTAIEIVKETLEEAGLQAKDIDWFVPHQANQRIIEASAQKLGIDSSKVVSTVHAHGNTSAASIPLALSIAQADGRLKKGDMVLLEAVGGGFTWAAAAIRW